MIETGEVKHPDIRTLEKIAATTGVPAVWLAFGAGECPPDDVIRETCSAHVGSDDVENLTPAPTARGAA